MSASNSANEPRKKSRCLIIQLADLGSSLQSLMALRAVQQLYPELEIHFVIRDRFSDAAKRISWLKNVHSFPEEKFLGPLLNQTQTIDQGVKELANWVAPLSEHPWDFVINWSFSEASSYLTALIPAHVKLGYSRREDFTLSCMDGWSQYIQAIIQGGHQKSDVEQNIHLTDILTTQLLTALQIHLGEPKQNDDAAAVTSKNFFSIKGGFEQLGFTHKDLSKKWVSLQLQESHIPTQWNPEAWAKIALEITENHPEYLILLLADSRNNKNAELFFSELTRMGGDKEKVRSFVGEIDFEIWTSLIAKSHWLITGDSAATQLASVLGTRVLHIAIEPNQTSASGPYGNGHYVVSASASAKAVYGIWDYASQEWALRKQLTLQDHLTQLGAGDELQTLEVRRSKIRHLNEGGGVVFEPITNHSLKIKEWTSQVIGHIARSWYCGWVPPVCHEISRNQIEPSLIQALRAMDESSEVLERIYAQARLESETLSKKCSHLRSDKLMTLADRTEIENTGLKLKELDRLAEQLGELHSPLRAFSQLSKVFMHNLKGTHLAELSHESAEAYHQLGNGVAILRSWIKHTLDKVKPVAIQHAPVIPLPTRPHLTEPLL